MNDYKYTDKNHPPIPLLKVGDKCYTFCDFGRHYDYVSTCEVRKVEVKWYEPSDYYKERLGAIGFWHIDYYIRIVEDYGRKSTKMYRYSTGEDGTRQNLFLTPQEVMDENIRDFMDMVTKNVAGIRRKMKALGYSEEKISKLLEYKA